MFNALSGGMAGVHSHHLALLANAQQRQRQDAEVEQEAAVELEAVSQQPQSNN